MYSTPNLLKRLYPMVGSITTLTNSDMSLFIAQADSEINAAISKRYTVPLSPTPPLLETLSSDISMYRILALRFFTQKQMNESVWPDRFKRAMDLLDSLSDGSITLVSSDGTLVSDSAGESQIKSSTLNYNPTFTEDDMTMSETDSDKITAIRAVR